MKELSMHILDIVQNSVRGRAKEIRITVNENEQDNIFEFTIEDNGTGIPEDIFKSIKNPFTTSRTMRRVGLGIPLLNDTCKFCNGSLNIETKEGVGTKVHAIMEYNHIDRPPLGDMVSTITGIVTSNETINIIYRHIFNNKEFDFQTSQIKEVVGDMSLADVNIYRWLKDFIKENLDEIKC